MLAAWTGSDDVLGFGAAAAAAPLDATAGAPPVAPPTAPVAATAAAAAACWRCGSRTRRASWRINYSENNEQLTWKKYYKPIFWDRSMNMLFVNTKRRFSQLNLKFQNPC